MKRFMVFICENYSALGGMNDFVSDHDTLEEANMAIENWVSETLNRRSEYESYYITTARIRAGHSFQIWDNELRKFALED